MKNDLGFKFGVGVTFEHVSLDEWKLLIEEYHEFIDYIYYSTRIDKKYHARIVEDDVAFHSVTPEQQAEFLKWCSAKYGIKTELCINAYNGVDDFDNLAAFKMELKYHVPDMVVTYTRLIEKLSNYEKEFLGSNVIKYTASYNNNFFTHDDMKKVGETLREYIGLGTFTSIVLGNRFIRDKNAIDTCRDMNVAPIILVNNGCSHNCGYCGSGTCGSSFMYMIADSGIHIPYSVVTVFPEEVRLMHEKWGIDLFKLSTRTFNYRQIDYLFKCMINNINEPEDIKDKNMFMFVMNPMYEWRQYLEYVNINSVREYKQKIYEVTYNNL